MSDNPNSSEGVQMDSGGNPDIPADYTVKIEDTGGKKKTVTVLKPDGSVLHVDRFDLDSARARKAFLDALVKKDPGIEKHRLQIEAKLVGYSKPSGEKAQPAVSYSADEKGMYVHSQGRTDQVTNWSALIVGNIARDDGSGQVETTFEVQVICGDLQRTLKVPAVEFDEMAWWSAVGSQPRIFATVRNGRALTADAIRFLSHGKTQHRTIYTHTGWRQLDLAGVAAGQPDTRQWVYLTRGGAIHAGGIDRSVVVELDDETSGYCIREAPPLEEVGEDTRAALRLQDVARPEIILPLLGVVFRSVITRLGYTTFLFGMTQSFKTSLCRNLMQFFGRDIFESGMIGWDSTTNSIEAVMYMLKDCPTYVDDYLPAQTRAEQDKQRAMNKRIIHGQANGTSRKRLNARSQPMASRPPRGSLITTGEDVPMGQSTQARTIKIPVRRGDIHKDALSECQAAGRAGKFERTMGAFLRWLAADYPVRLAEVTSKTEAIRNSLTRAKVEPRNSEAVSHVLYGLDLLADFALACGAMTTQQADEWRQKGGWAAAKLALEADEDAAHKTPTERFLALLRMALAAKKAYIARVDGSMPSEPAQWGYEGYSATAPGAMKIGWLATDGQVYLEPGQTMKVINSMLIAGETFGFSEETMQNHLLAAGHLLEHRGRKRVPKRVEGRQICVWILKKDVLSTDEPQGEPPADPAGPTVP